MKHLVIGGGLIGLLSAYYLRAAGEDVTVLEKGKLGNESSWAGGGILSPLYPWRYPPELNQLVFLSQSLYPELVNTLELNTDLQIELQQSGMLVLDNGEIDSAINWSPPNPVRVELAGPEQIKKIAPSLNRKYQNQHAAWLPDIGQIRNPRLLKALVKFLRDNGTRLEEGVTVTSLIIDNRHNAGVQTDHGPYYADATIVACGAWSPLLINELTSKVNMEPVRGQMILFKARPGLLNTIVMLDSHYLIPRKDGRILAGSTLEYVGFNKDVTEEAAEQLYNRAVDLVPELKNYSIERHWSGLRPGAPRNIPVIGPHPDLSGVFINTCHFRNGVVTAPGSATLLTNHILDKKSTLDLNYYTF